MPGFNISAFKANGLRYGGARPSQFTVTLTFPSLPEISATASSQLQFVCYAATLPESIIGSVEVPYFGRRIKLAGDRQFPNWSVRVLNDEDFNIKNAFEAWHNAINTIISNRLDERVANITSPQNANSYKTRAIVTQFTKQGPGDIDGDGAAKSYTFEGLFPVNIGGIQVGWHLNDQVEEFDVEFAYDWWEPSQRANDVPLFPLEI